MKNRLKTIICVLLSCLFLVVMPILGGCDNDNNDSIDSSYGYVKHTTSLTISNYQSYLQLKYTFTREKCSWNPYVYDVTFYMNFSARDTSNEFSNCKITVSGKSYSLDRYGNTYIVVTRTGTTSTTPPNVTSVSGTVTYFTFERK